ncbi:MAG: phosphohistidine phosphatase SixA [Deltaproteobacteria bacterium]|nr:phosphohistidine phosphatase SixA [Deltaproteobacteria bacterium]
MSLFLVQHGKSLSKDLDPDQGLSEQGISDVKRIAEVAKEYNVHVSGIRHSGKTRARTTAEIFASALTPKNGVQQVVGIAPMDDVTAFAKTIIPYENKMFVGHLPFMERLTAWLITGSQEKPVFKFQNGGIVCLDVFPETESWAIKWTLMPNID